MLYQWHFLDTALCLIWDVISTILQGLDVDYCHYYTKEGGNGTVFLGPQNWRMPKTGFDSQLADSGSIQFPIDCTCQILPSLMSPLVHPSSIGWLTDVWVWGGQALRWEDFLKSCCYWLHAQNVYSSLSQCRPVVYVIYIILNYLLTGGKSWALTSWFLHGRQWLIFFIKVDSLLAKMHTEWILENKYYTHIHKYKYTEKIKKEMAITQRYLFKTICSNLMCCQIPASPCSKIPQGNRTELLIVNGVLCFFLHVTSLRSVKTHSQCHHLCVAPAAHPPKAGELECFVICILKVLWTLRSHCFSLLVPICLSAMDNHNFKDSHCLVDSHFSILPNHAGYKVEV